MNQKGLILSQLLKDTEELLKNANFDEIENALTKIVQIVENYHMQQILWKRYSHFSVDMPKPVVMGRPPANTNS